MARVNDDFDLSSVISPVKESGLDPTDPRSAQAFINLASGGLGKPETNTPAVTPAAVSSSGSPQSATATAAGARALELLNNAPNPAQELQREQTAEQQLQRDQAVRAQDLRDPESGKLQQPYRPSVGQRILRGLRGAGEGLALGGIPGAIRGAAVPGMVPGGRSYGASNMAGEQELRREDANVAADQQSLAEISRRAKEGMEGATGLAREYNAAGRLIQDSKDKAAKPEKTERVVDSKGVVRFVTPEEANAGTYQDPQTYSKENAADKTQPVINKKTKGLEYRSAQEINARPGVYEAVSTNNTVIRDATGGSYLPVYDKQGNLHYFNPKTNQEVTPPQGLAKDNPNKPQARAKLGSYETHKDDALKLLNLRYRWDPASKEYVNPKDEDDKLSVDEWRQQRQVIQNEYEAGRASELGQEQQHIELDPQGNWPGVSNAPAVPGAVSPSGTQPVPPTKQNQPTAAAKAPPPPQQSHKLDPMNPQDVALAHLYLQKAGGDKAKARQLAKADGHSL